MTCSDIRQTPHWLTSQNYFHADSDLEFFGRSDSCPAGFSLQTSALVTRSLAADDCAQLGTLGQRCGERATESTRSPINDQPRGRRPTRECKCSLAGATGHWYADRRSWTTTRMVDPSPPHRVFACFRASGTVGGWWQGRHRHRGSWIIACPVFENDGELAVLDCY